MEINEKQTGPRFKPPFIRQWRERAGLSLEELAGKAQTNKGNLSKVERGLLPYNQELLERLASALDTTPGNLISIEPGAQIISIWGRAPLDVQRQIVEVAEALIRAGSAK